MTVASWLQHPRELSRWDLANAAVGPDLLLVCSPSVDLAPRLARDLEPVLARTFVPEAPIEALDLGVLKWPAGLNQDVVDVMGLNPIDECSARALRAVVGVHCSGRATE